MIYAILLGALFTGCSRNYQQIEPAPIVAKHPKEVQRERRLPLQLPEDFSCSPFAPLSDEEREQEWGKEYWIALQFAADFDLYRAVSTFKRSLYLMPEGCSRQQEVLYQITLAYFLGRMYGEVLHTVETSSLCSVESTFPAYRDLLVILFESYTQVGDSACAAQILEKIDNQLPAIGEKLALCCALRSANFAAIDKHENPYIGKMMEAYHGRAKSVRKAEWLNALCPGAGYWYLGQKQTAMTAFLVNSLFIATATQFFVAGNVPAGAIALSLEGGWYFGGIYGAGLSAKHYNEKLYSGYAEKIYKKEKCFPTMMLKYSF